MSQAEIKSWVIISNVKDKPDMQKLPNVALQVSSLVDEWQSRGKMMWSGSFDNEISSMAVFEATESEANDFYKKYDRYCSGVLEYTMYQWDAMPILSILSNDQ